MIDPILPLVFATALALLFGMAAQHKLGVLKNKRFAAQMQAYQLLPEVLVAPAARALPWLELGVAFTLLIPQTRPAAALLGAALLLLYAGAMAINLLRGRNDIDCGCGDAPQKLSWWLVARNALLALFALLPLTPITARALQFTDFIFVVLLTLLLSIAALALDQLLRNHTTFNQQES
jgi:hypothetical protein